jgi:hypothetical protein
MKSTLVALAGTLLVCAGAAAQSVTVTKPAANDTCTEGQACPIQWTSAGLPGANVIVDLLDKVSTTVIRPVAYDLPIGDGQFPWTVPGDIPAGQYRIRVRVHGAAISDFGDVFTIKAPSGGFKPQPGQAAKKTIASTAINPQVAPSIAPVRILVPSPGTTWEVGKSYMIHWTADTKPDDGFDVDLCDAAGTKKLSLLSGAAQRNPDGSWSIQSNIPCDYPEGGYKIRVTSWYAKRGVTSGRINAVIKTRKIVQNIAVHAENVELIVSNCTTTNLTNDCEQPDQRNRARVGRIGGENGTNFGWSKLRSRLTFDLSELQKKQGKVESATLIPGDIHTCRHAGQGVCFSRLVAMNAGDVNTWKKFQIPQNGVLYPLTGWSSPISETRGVDITVPVRDWINGTWHNFGFVVEGVSEETMGCSPHEGPFRSYSCLYECLTYFTPIMYVTFIEKVNPCNPT